MDERDVKYCLQLLPQVKRRKVCVVGGAEVCVQVFTMALKALMRIFGLKKEEKKTAAPRCHPYDEVSDEQATATRRPPRVHPYDEVSDEQLNEKRRTPRVHPYDEVSDEQLNEKRRTPRVHPYDEVSDAVLEQNRLGRPARRHEYDEVDLEPGMARVKDSE